MKIWKSVVLSCVILVALSVVIVARAEEPPLVDDKYSLKADREAMEALRKDIPAERQKLNDEKAFMDEMMTDLSKHPSLVRSRFSTLLNKKRSVFNKDMTKDREVFSLTQRQDREKFTKDQTAVRKDFSRKKTSSEERQDFFGELDSRRKDFYSVQKEKRDEFEANMKDKRKNFDDYVRSKTDEFNQLHRDYTKRYEENKKLLSNHKKQAEIKRKQTEKDLENEYRDVNAKPATPLEVGQ